LGQVKKGWGWTQRLMSTARLGPTANTSGKDLLHLG